MKVYTIPGLTECHNLRKTIVYDANFIRCVTIHPPDGPTEFSSADPSGGFQLVSPIGNVFGNYIEYNKHGTLNDVPGS